MMEYRVIKSFIDKNTGTGYNENNTFTSSDAERVSFLIDEGYIAGVKPQPTIQIPEELLTEAKESKIKGYTKMTEEELRAAIDAENAKKASE